MDGLCVGVGFIEYCIEDDSYYLVTPESRERLGNTKEMRGLTVSIDTDKARQIYKLLGA
jgi:hypothetical protein